MSGFPKVIILSILVIFLMATVSAAENTTEVTSLDENSLEEVNETLSEDFGEDSSQNISITFDEQMYEKNLTDISVEFPQNTTGNFTVKINDEVIYNREITNSSISIPIKLPKPKFPVIVDNRWPPNDVTVYEVTAFLNDLEVDVPHDLKVMKFTPDSAVISSIPDEILQYDDGPNFIPAVIFQRSANGQLELYVDGKRIAHSQISNSFAHFNATDISALPLGNHTFSVIYQGDSYYRPKNITYNFTVVNVIIKIPNRILIDHDDCISLNVLKNTSGEVFVYLNDILIKRDSVKDGDYILSLAGYVKVNSTSLKVEFISKDFSRVKQCNITLDFYFDIFMYGGIYGEDNTIEISLPDNLNNRLLNLTIDGVRHDFTRPKYIMNNIVEVDISKLNAGNHTLFVAYPGDERFYAYNKTFNFTVYYDVVYPDYLDYMGGSVIYLNLPEDANGNLTIYDGGKFLKTAPLNEGHVSIRIDTLKPGDHNLLFKYTGSDYNISSGYGFLTVNPKITTAYELAAGEDRYIVVETPKDCKGEVYFNDYKVAVKNGLAKFPLSKLGVGEHEFEIMYCGSDGFNMSYYRVITVYPVKIRTSFAKNVPYTDAVLVKVSIISNGKILKSGKVTFTFNSKRYVVSIKNGIATFKASNLVPDKYSLKISYADVKLTKTIKVYSILSLKKVNVKKSAKRLVLTATLKKGNKALKGVKVAFKFNGKSYNAITTKKGIAKVTVKKADLNKLKVGKKVTYQARFGKNIVKSTAVVKR